MHLSRQPLPLEERNILVNCRALCPDDDPVPPGFNEWGSSFSVEGYMMRTLLEPIVADPEDQVPSAIVQAGSLPGRQGHIKPPR